MIDFSQQKKMWWFDEHALSTMVGLTRVTQKIAMYVKTLVLRK